MNTIRAIYEGGVFRPLEPVDLPDRTEVVFAPTRVADQLDSGMDDIYEVLSRRFRSGQHDTAERHNEHQP